MDLTAEHLGAAAVGLVVIVGAIGNYLRNRKEQPVAKVDPVLAGVGLELGSREQTERLIKAVESIAIAINDKKQSDMDDKLDELLERLDDRPRRR